MAARKSVDDGVVYQLKVTLRGSKPPIWRRIEVSGNTRLNKLHNILQIVMGWWNCHLHAFEFPGGERYTSPEFGAEWSDLGATDLSDKKVTLAEVAPMEKASFYYEYDFGDDWYHRVVVERIRPKEAGVRYPRCLAGKRRCPPEDCGGIWGYADLLEAVRDPNHERHEELVEWLPAGFDAEAFNLAEVNQQLKHLR